MTVKGVIMDAMTNEPLAGASVVVVDHSGVNLGVGVKADSNGMFSLDSSLLDGDANQLLITYVSYQAALVDPSVVSKGVTAVPVYLTPDGAMEAVTVTPTKNNWGLAFLIVGVFDAIIFSLPVKKT